MREFDIGDNKRAVGSDLEVDDFGDVIELCARSPIGQCQYTWRDNWRRCMHCQKPSGLD